MVQLSKPPEETVKMGILVDSLSVDGLQFSFSSRMWGAPPRWNHFFRSRARYNIEITPSNAFHLSKGIV